MHKYAKAIIVDEIDILREAFDKNMKYLMNTYYSSGINECKNKKPKPPKK